MHVAHDWDVRCAPVLWNEGHVGCFKAGWSASIEAFQICCFASRFDVCCAITNAQQRSPGLGKPARSASLGLEGLRRKARGLCDTAENPTRPRQSRGPGEQTCSGNAQASSLACFTELPSPKQGMTQSLQATRPGLPCATLLHLPPEPGRQASATALQASDWAVSQHSKACTVFGWGFRAF